MAELVVSCITYPLAGNARGYRIWSDGRAETYQVTQPERLPDGGLAMRAVPPDFYPVAQLDAGQVEDIAAQVEAAGLQAMPDVVAIRSIPTAQPDRIEWQFPQDDAIRTISIAPWPPADGEPTGALMDLVLRIGEIILAVQSGSTSANP